MINVKPGDKFRVKKDIFDTYAPSCKYHAGAIVEVERVCIDLGVSFKGDIHNSMWYLNPEYFELVEEEKPMTPCEKLGYKVGDAFIAPYKSYPVKKGDIVYLVKDDGSNSPFFSKTKNQKFSDVCFFIEHKEESIVAKPYKPQTEAEKRGAKFGVCGVIKKTGERFLFSSESLVLKGYWEILVEGETRIFHRKPELLRLDHEPEYKEIPFAEATHEQRMNIDNLVHRDGHKVTEIFQFKNGVYAYTVAEDNLNRFNTLNLTVRVPA